MPEMFVSDQIPNFLSQKLNANLYLVKNHPICITKELVFRFFDDLKQSTILKFEHLPKEVSVYENFDALLIPPEHPSRRCSDTYYTGPDRVLRTHATAHQNDILSKGYREFLIAGDVYRKDSVDRSHYFVFHQIDGVLKVPAGKDGREFLEETLEHMMDFLFPGKLHKLSDDYFPFTQNSIEAEILHEDRWLEILGGGVVHSTILNRHGIDETLIAFGLGIERLAMLLFEIPDIRLFWSTDKQFLDQFSSNQILKYVPFSKLQPISFDISFFIKNDQEIENGDWIGLNDFHEFMREQGRGLIESVDLFDKFQHPKQHKLSYSFRIIFSPISAWTNPATLFEEADKIMQITRLRIESRLSIILR